MGEIKIENADMSSLKQCLIIVTENSRVSIQW